MDCSKTCAGAVASFPNDPLVEILSRVPAKSVWRFKCVSKAWRDLIADPLHRKKIPQTLGGFFFDGKRDDLHFVGVFGVSVRHIDPCFRFLTEVSGIGKFWLLDGSELPGIEKIWLLGGSNGLLLFACIQESNKSLSYIVSNPATKQWVAVPSSDCKWSSLPNGTLSSLIFDPVASSHFHLVQIMDHEMVHVYSSKSGVWSSVGYDWGDFELETRLNSMYCNGMVYVVLYGDEMDHIAVMDVDGKTRKVIPVTLQVDDEFWPFSDYVGQSPGRLHYIFHADLDRDEMPPKKHRYKLFIWILEDYETEKWVLKDTVSFSHLFGKKSCQKFNVVAVHPDHSMVYLVQHCNRKLISYRKLVSYNMDSKEVCHICELGDGYEFIPYVPYFSELSSLENKN